MKIGIIGCGYVGSALKSSFSHTADVEVMVSDPALNDMTVADIVKCNPDAIFICVPTPQKQDKMVDGSIVRGAIDQIPEGMLTIVKSTITPDFLPDKKGLVMNPEFLTQANAEFEFMNPDMMVLGGSDFDTAKVIEVYSRSRIASCPVYLTDVITACFVKYALNSFLATKVVFMNQLHEFYAEYSGTQWDSLVDIMKADKRIGGSHMKVPNEGNYGFGGACFPKDTNAFCGFAAKMGFGLTLLHETIEANNEIVERKNT